MTGPLRPAAVTVTFAGSGDAFGSGGRLQACIHLRTPGQDGAVLLDCGATSLAALKRLDLEPNEVAVVVISHLHGDHFGGLPFLILDGQFRRRTRPLLVAGPPGITGRLGQAMEVLFPGSSGVTRRFGVHVTELRPGQAAHLAGAGLTAWQARHPSGAPPLILRLDLAGRRIAYTGDTAWTAAIAAAADRADLLIAEAYTLERDVPHHLSHRALAAHRAELTCGRIVVTHMSEDVLGQPGAVRFERAHDGLAIEV